MTSATTHDTAVCHANSVSDESILKIAKEITVKFIEVGRITPATFGDNFSNIYGAIEATVRKKER